MPSIDHLSWDEIGRISAGGDARTQLGLGATKHDTLKDGTQVLYRIIDFDHDTLANGAGTAPVSWEMFHVLQDSRPMNRNGGNAGGWERSDIRRWLNRDFYGLCSDELLSIVRPVIKLTSVGDGRSDIVRTEDHFWLPSEIEVFGETHYSYLGEGEQYAFHRQEGRYHQRTRPDASPAHRWLRSPYHGYDGLFCTVGSDGGYYYYYSDWSSWLAPAFCS